MALSHEKRKKNNELEAKPSESALIKSENGKKMKELEQSRTALLNILEDSEEARREAEAEKSKTMAIITNFSDGLLFFDNSDKLSLINPQAEALFDVKSRDVVGRTISGLATFPTIKPVAQLLAQSTREIFRQELSLENPKQQTIEVSTVSVVKDQQKMGKLIILHDVTREKRVEKLKSEFVSLAAHQLRTPLSEIKWSSKMLLDGDAGNITPEQRDLLDKSYQSNERMIALVNDLLNVTRIEEGKYIYQPVTADLSDITQSVIDSLKNEITKKKIRFDFQRLTKLSKVKVDVEKMKLVIANLLENAIQYTNSGGEIKLSLSQEDKEIKFKIQDTGVGIPAEEQNRIFTKFFRAANVIRMETEGSGLGLFITKNIVEAHGGRIWFESEEGKGTTFYVALPATSKVGRFLGKF